MHIADTSGQDTLIQKKSRPLKWYALAGVAVIGLLLFYVVPAVSSWQASDASVSAARLRLANVGYGDLVRDLSIEGRVVAAVSPRLYSPAQGTITFTVDAGDEVAKDQVLATIDSPDLTNQLEQENAALEELQTALSRQRIQAKKAMLDDQKAVDLAQITLTAASREKRRADKAYETKTISNIDFEKAQDDLRNAELVHQHAISDAELNKESLLFEIKSKEHQLTRQELKVAELQRQVDSLELRSPVSGIVGNLAVEQKNQVAKNQAILSVVDLSEFELEVGIPESYADDLALGMQAQVNVNGQMYPAKLVTISPEIENNQVTGRVRFVADGSNASPVGLRQNQRLTTRILMENKPNVLMVQRGQFLDNGGGRVAYVVRDNIAYRTPIATGARSLAAVEITSGLNEHDTIIVSGIAQFNNAETVLITQ